MIATGTRRAAVRQLALAVLSVLAASMTAADTARNADRPDSLRAALGQLQRGFQQSSAAHLRPLLAAEHKVYLAVPAIERTPGFLGSDQLYYLLRSFFERHPTARFALGRQTADRQRRTVYVKADWSYRTESDKTRDEPLRITLVEQDGRWSIRELRAARA